MPTYDIPGIGILDLSKLVLDLNGTIAIDGEIVSGIKERLVAIQATGIKGYLLTADTRGRGAQTARSLGLELHRLTPGDERAQKGDFVRTLDADHIVAIGNGANDEEMLRAARVGIAVIQAEGLSGAALRAADLVVPQICDALDLLLKPKRLLATMRK